MPSRLSFRLLLLPLLLLPAATAAQTTISGTGSVVDVDLVALPGTDSVLAFVESRPVADGLLVDRHLWDPASGNWTFMGRTDVLECPEADATTFDGLYWSIIPFDDDNPTVFYNTFDAGGITDSVGALPITRPPGARVLETAVDGSSAALFVLVAYSDGSFEVFRGTPSEPVPAPLDVFGLGAGSPRFASGLAVATEEAGGSPLPAGARFSYFDEDDRLVTFDLWWNVVDARWQASATTPDPAPATIAGLDRTSIAIRGGETLQANDGWAFFGGAPIALRHRADGELDWSELDTSGFGTTSRNSHVRPDAGGFLVTNTFETGAGPAVAITSVSAAGIPRVRHQGPVRALADRTELDVVDLGGGIVGSAWIEGELGSEGARAHFELVDLAALEIFADGFETGDTSAWSG